MPNDTAPDQLSFEHALAELEAIVSELERGETALDQTIARFERGIALARRCEDRLNEASAKVALLLREGSRVVEVDANSGQLLSETHDPGDEIVPEEPRQEAESPRPEPQQSEPPDRPEPPHPARAQQSLLGDDDIPF